MKLIPYVLAALGLILVYNQAHTNGRDTKINRQNGLRSQTYTIATNCFAAANPNDRTPKYTLYCYQRAEAITGVKVIHFGVALEQ